MKILVVGIDGANPDLLFGSESLTSIRCLMSAGVYGRIESVVPSTPFPAWMCLATSQDPGSLGVYGPRNRVDRSYELCPDVVDARLYSEPAIWGQFCRLGKRPIVLNLPQGSLPTDTGEKSQVGIDFWLNPKLEAFSYPETLADEIRRLVQLPSVLVKGFQLGDRRQLQEGIATVSRDRFRAARQLLETEAWDYFHFVDRGLYQMHRAFGKDHDPGHLLHDPGSPFRTAIPDYYAHLDAELGQIMERLDDQTILAAVSCHGSQSMLGRFHINEWLVREGLLVLNRAPETVTDLDELDVNWKQTRAWCIGGHHAQVFLNVRGRESQGVIVPAGYEAFRDELQARLQATVGPDGKPLGTQVFRPEEIYRNVRGLAPDLIVQFGGLAWRASGSLGHAGLHEVPRDDEPDDCNPTFCGAFLLAAPGLAVSGEITGASLLDIAPTLLQLAGHEVPESMQGRPLVPAQQHQLPTTDQDEQDAEAIIRERLSGLGYI